ncbi:hypothetical protein B0J14DRAFT_648846 [Halenospora varia]|nr:hypothetical protein B0J14DRAFT_648846 [Halenospora varia]
MADTIMTNVLDPIFDGDHYRYPPRELPAPPAHLSRNNANLFEDTWKSVRDITKEHIIIEHSLVTVRKYSKGFWFFAFRVGYVTFAVHTLQLNRDVDHRTVDLAWKHLVKEKHKEWSTQVILPESTKNSRLDKALAGTSTAVAQRFWMRRDNGGEGSSRGASMEIKQKFKGDERNHVESANRSLKREAKEELHNSRSRPRQFGSPSLDYDDGYETDDEKGPWDAGSLLIHLIK